jgi:hypothetical protein
MGKVLPKSLVVVLFLGTLLIIGLLGYSVWQQNHVSDSTSSNTTKVVTSNSTAELLSVNTTESFNRVDNVPVKSANSLTIYRNGSAKLVYPHAYHPETEKDRTFAIGAFDAPKIIADLAQIKSVADIPFRACPLASDLTQRTITYQGKTSDDISGCPLESSATPAEKELIQLVALPN